MLSLHEGDTDPEPRYNNEKLRDVANNLEHCLLVDTLGLLAEFPWQASARSETAETVKYGLPKDSCRRSVSPGACKCGIVVGGLELLLELRLVATASEDQIYGTLIKPDELLKTGCHPSSLDVRLLREDSAAR